MAAAGAGAGYEVEVTIVGARDLKNVNWKYGDLKPYAVVWIDPAAAKCSSKVWVEGGVNPEWEEKLRIPMPPNARIEDSTLCIDIVHTRSEGQEDTKPLVGSARLPLREVVDEAGIGGKCTKTLTLKRPSGRPQGKVEVKVAVKEPPRSSYYDPYAPPYGSSAPSRDAYPAPYGRAPQPHYGYGQPYGAPPPAGYPYTAPPPPPPYGGAPPPPTSAYGAPPAPYGGGPTSSYGAPPQAQAAQQKKSKFGAGAGLAVGAAAGLLGGLALAEGIDYAEDKIAEDAAHKVEDDLAYEDGGFDDF